MQCFFVTPHEHALNARGCSLLSCALMDFPSWHVSKRFVLIICIICVRSKLTPTTLTRRMFWRPDLGWLITIRTEKGISNLILIQDVNCFNLKLFLLLEVELVSTWIWICFSLESVLLLECDQSLPISSISKILPISPSQGSPCAGKTLACWTHPFRTKPMHILTKGSPTSFKPSFRRASKRHRFSGRCSQPAQRKAELAQESWSQRRPWSPCVAWQVQEFEIAEKYGVDTQPHSPNNGHMLVCAELRQVSNLCAKGQRRRTGLPSAQNSNSMKIITVKVSMWRSLLLLAPLWRIKDKCDGLLWGDCHRGAIFVHLMADDSTLDFSHVFQFRNALLQAYDLGMSSYRQSVAVRLRFFIVRWLLASIHSLLLFGVRIPYSSKSSLWYGLVIHVEIRGSPKNPPRSLLRTIAPASLAWPQEAAAIN